MGNFPVSPYLYDESCLHVRIYMIMAPTRRRQQLEAVLVEKPRWKRWNIGYIDPDEPVTMKNGRVHYLIYWDNSGFKNEYVDCSLVSKMEDVSKSKCTRQSPDEVRISPEQRVALRGLGKDRTLGRRLFEESSSTRRRIVEDDDTLELSIDPFAEVPPDEKVQPKAPHIEMLEAANKEEEDIQSSKPHAEGRQKLPRLHEKSTTSSGRSRLIPEETLLAEEDVQASKPLVEGRQKYPRLQESSKQFSRRRRLIPEEPLLAKAPPTERVEAGKKEAAKTPPEERVRLQSSKPHVEGRQKLP